MAELKIRVPEGLEKIIGEIEEPETEFLRKGVEDRCRMLALFKVVDNILKKSKLTDDEIKELAEEYKERVAKRHGL